MRIKLYVVIDRRCIPVLQTATVVEGKAIRDAQGYNAMPDRAEDTPFGVATFGSIVCDFTQEHLKTPRDGADS